MILLVWTCATTLSLILSILLLKSYVKTKDGSALLAVQAREMLPKNSYQLYAALPQVLGNSTIAVAKEDARPVLLRQFLQKYNSPLMPYAQTLVTVSDNNDIDFRLITSIAMCESNLGKKMPQGSFNAWGYAIYTGQSAGANFENWDHAIKVMADYLAKNFYSRGLTTPEQIGPIYAPPSVETGNSWARCVRRFMDELI